MEWTPYLADFFCGLFFMNCIPHLVNGLSGNRFPTVFSKPRGIGLSGPATNVIWGCVNLNIAYFLLRHGNLSLENRWSFYTMLIAFLLGGIALGKRFQKKHKDEPAKETEIVKE